MKLPGFRKIDIRPRVLVGWFVSLAALVFCGFELLHTHGVVHTTLKNGPGCICHGFTVSPAVSVFISGPDTLAPGQIAPYTIVVVKDSNLGAGFNVAAFRGDLLVGDSLEQQWLEEELTHLETKLRASSDTISWTFLYGAPASPGPDTLYAVGNSVNLDYELDGDEWNFSPNKIVRIAGTAGVKVPEAELASIRFQQNYPNPFNPTTNFQFTIGNLRFVSLKVYDLLGRELETLVNEVRPPGSYTIEWRPEGLPSGVYFALLQSGEYQVYQKILLMK